MPAADTSLTLSFLYTYINANVTGSKSETFVQCFVCHSIAVFRFDLLHCRKRTVTDICATKQVRVFLLQKRVIKTIAVRSSLSSHSKGTSAVKCKYKSFTVSRR